MPAQIQIVGDEILFDGQKVAAFHSNLTPSLRFGFCDAVADIRDETDVASELETACEGSYAEGVQLVIDELRSAIEPLENIEVDRLEKMIDDMEERYAA
jgi:hypothetical protein